jgi:hypothetical protein
MYVFILWSLIIRHFVVFRFVFSCEKTCISIFFSEVRGFASLALADIFKFGVYGENKKQPFHDWDRNRIDLAGKTSFSVNREKIVEGVNMKECKWVMQIYQ